LEIEFLNDLENKISALLATLDGVRKQNADYAKELEEKDTKITELEVENDNLKKELEQIKSSAANQQEKLHLTTEKIQGILARLELAQ
jgi:archaellum component FlaC